MCRRGRCLIYSEGGIRDDRTQRSWWRIVDDGRAGRRGCVVSVNEMGAERFDVGVEGYELEREVLESELDQEQVEWLAEEKSRP